VLTVGQGVRDDQDIMLTINNGYMFDIQDIQTRIFFYPTCILFIK